MELMSAIVLLLGAFYSALTAHCLPNSFGKEFITAFPENIAYYHPTNPNNRVVITALYSNTFVTVTMKDPSFIETQQLSAGVPYDFLTTIGTELARPGLLLNLIPTASFSSCYLIQTITNVQNNQALLVVPTDQTQGVKLGNGLLTLTWTPMIGTGYSWGLAYLQAYETSHIIWHSSSKMAVYYLGETTNSVFGNPAASLNTDPDSMGCVVKPALVELGTQQGGWPESIQYCQTLGYSLVSLNTEEMLLSVASKLRESGLQAPGQHQAWIGLRRSSLTGQWYWLSQQNVSFTHWAKNEPGTTTEGQCAMMFVDPDGNYTWSDQSCCEALPAVCYQGPTYLSLW
ncbi:hypothetical protein UPYG_G00155550 [Umbra pygmaea]|uniref:C-type lectin domain-containing protein n=1 Tax=Umbra pygmaea TaxID=75934 RepID=A0ABD0X269_UMBPY